MPPLNDYVRVNPERETVIERLFKRVDMDRDGWINFSELLFLVRVPGREGGEKGGRGEGRERGEKGGREGGEYCLLREWEGRKEGKEVRKEGRRVGRKEGRKQGREGGSLEVSTLEWWRPPLQAHS